MEKRRERAELVKDNNWTEESRNVTKKQKREKQVPETSKNRIEKAEGIPSINRRQTLGSIQLKSKRIL